MVHFDMKNYRSRARRAYWQAPVRLRKRKLRALLKMPSTSAQRPPEILKGSTQYLGIVSPKLMATKPNNPLPARRTPLQVGYITDSTSTLGAKALSRANPGAGRLGQQIRSQ